MRPFGNEGYSLSTLCSPSLVFFSSSTWSLTPPHPRRALPKLTANTDELRETGLVFSKNHFRNFSSSQKAQSDNVTAWQLHWQCAFFQQLFIILQLFIERVYLSFKNDVFCSMTKKKTTINCGGLLRADSVCKEYAADWGEVGKELQWVIFNIMSETLKRHPAALQTTDHQARPGPPHVPSLPLLVYKSPKEQGLKRKGANGNISVLAWVCV